MLDCINKFFPSDVKVIKPENEMFLWVTLPKHKSALKLFNKCADHNVVFVPGSPFYTIQNEDNLFRLNYTNSAEDDIEKGIKIIASIIESM